MIDEKAAQNPPPDYPGPPAADQHSQYTPPQAPPPPQVSQQGFPSHQGQPPQAPQFPSPPQQPSPGHPYPPAPNNAQSPPVQDRSIGYSGQPGGGYPQGPPQQQFSTDAQLGAQFQQQLWARCARGDHNWETKYGACGIITAVLLFPIGLICLFMDTERKCTRCGTVVG